MTSYDDKWPGDAAFVPVLEELNRRKAKVFVHPLAPYCCLNLVPKVGNAIIEYPYDSGRAILSLLFNGRFAAFRDITWIFCHAGGPIPMLAGRIENSARASKDRDQFAPKGLAYEFQRLHYETANSAYAPTMAALLKFVPASQILFGTRLSLYLGGPTMSSASASSAFRRRISRRSSAATRAKLFPRAHGVTRRPA